MAKTDTSHDHTSRYKIVPGFLNFIGHIDDEASKTISIVTLSFLFLKSRLQEMFEPEVLVLILNTHEFISS